MLERAFFVYHQHTVHKEGYSVPNRRKHIRSEDFSVPPNISSSNLDTQALATDGIAIIESCFTNDSTHVTRMDVFAAFNLGRVIKDHRGKAALEKTIETAIALRQPEEAVVVTPKNGESILAYLAQHHRIKQTELRTLCEPAQSQNGNAIILSCMDFKIHSHCDLAIRTAHDLHLNKLPAVIAMVGGGLYTELAIGFLQSQADYFQNKEIIITLHTNCAACHIAHRGQFSNSDQEATWLNEQIQSRLPIYKATLPGISISTAIIELKHDNAPGVAHVRRISS